VAFRKKAPSSRCRPTSCCCRCRWRSRNGGGGGFARGVHGCLRRRRRARICDRRACSTTSIGALADRALRALSGKVDALSAPPMAEWGAVIIPGQGPDADPLQAGGPSPSGFAGYNNLAVRPVLRLSRRAAGRFFRGSHPCRQPAAPNRSSSGADPQPFRVSCAETRRGTAATDQPGALSDAADVELRRVDVQPDENRSSSR